MRNTVVLTIVFLLTTSLLFAQEPVVKGRITDHPSGLPIQKATVNLESSATGLNTTASTNADGNYAFPPVQPGVYSIVVKAGGFSDSRVEDIHLEVGGARTVDVQLQTASVQQQVTVSATEPEVTADRADRGNVRRDI